MPIRMGNGGSHEDKGWELVTSGTKRKALASPEDLLPQNRFSAVIANQELGSLSYKVSEPIDHEQEHQKKW